MRVVFTPDSPCQCGRDSTPPAFPRRHAHRTVAILQHIRTTHQSGAWPKRIAPNWGPVKGSRRGGQSRLAGPLAGRHGEAMAINERLIPLHKALFVESNPIPVKWAVHRLGLIGPGIRLPLTSLSAPLHGTVAAAMAASGIESG